MMLLFFFFKEKYSKLPNIALLRHKKSLLHCRPTFLIFFLYDDTYMYYIHVGVVDNLSAFENIFIA